MPTLPWMPGPAHDGPATDGAAKNVETVVLASWFRLRRYRDVVPFLVDAMRIHRQVRASAGNIGVALVADPVRREFRTLSQWRTDADIRAMVRTEPHASVMVRYRSAMASSEIRTWTTTTTPTWDDAQAHRAG